MGIMLAALDVNGRESAPGAVDACLDRLPGARRALDLGGGPGQYALELARRGLDVTLQDQAPAVQWVEQRGELAAAGVARFTGDFFETFPDRPFDLVFCSGVVYTYGPDDVVELYRRARVAIAPGGALAVHTFVRGDVPLAPIFAVQMLGSRRGGDTHSLDEHREWLRHAGYSRVEPVRLARRPEQLIMAWP
jgi:SAM-dependent methyltransferase